MTQDDYVVMKKTSREKLINELKQLKKENKILRKNAEHNDKVVDKVNWENQQLKENYDRIYNENCKLREEHNITDISLLDENYKLKKQKDDVVEIIKRQLLSNTNITKYTDEMCLRHVLRMLGEIE